MYVLQTFAQVPRISCLINTYRSNSFFFLQTWSLWKDGKVMELVNQSIDHSLPVAEILRCIKIALLCVQDRPGDRPTMYLVLKMLDNDNALEIEPTQPGFVDFRGPLDQTNSSTREQDLSLNYASVTMPQVR